METSNQTEDSSTPYGYDEPPQQGQEPEQGQESPPQADAAWEWHPTPPVTRATTSFEYPEQAPQEEGQPSNYPASQPLPLPLPEPAQPQHFYSPKVQPIQRPQPTPTQPLEQAPGPQPSASPPTPTQRIPQPSPAGHASPPRRRAILQEDSERAEQLGLSDRATTSYMVSGVRHANKRRSNSLIKLLGLLFLVNLLIIGACGAWLYNHFVTQVEARMSDFASRPQSGGSLATARAPLAAATGGATAVEIKQLHDDFDKRFSDLKAQLQAAQSRITEFESAQQQQQTRVSALASQMASAGGDAVSANASPGEAAGAAVVPGVESEIAPSANELILLKERNRLTSYADEAIATGAREPYERLWEALEDPRLIKLIHGARSEILRVQNFYLSGTRIESYTIQVGDYFPENAALKDSQLRDEQLIELLEKKENPWQVRMKAANLLGLRRSRAVGDALVRAVKYDPNLDVVKEATFSFEQMSGFRARIFEPASMDAWWTQYNAAPASAANVKSTTAAVDAKAPKKNPPPPPSQPAPAPAPAPMREMQPELRLPEWDEEQEARERANKAVADQQKAREKKDAEKQAAAKAADEEKTPEKKKKPE